MSSPTQCQPAHARRHHSEGTLGHIVISRRFPALPQAVMAAATCSNGYAPTTAADCVSGPALGEGKPLPNCLCVRGGVGFGESHRYDQALTLAAGVAAASVNVSAAATLGSASLASDSALK